MKKNLIILISSLVVALIGVGTVNIVQANKEKELDKQWAEEKTKEEQERIETLMANATQADFKELNQTDLNLLAKDVFVEGTVESVITDTVPMEINLSTIEGDGFGIYTITYYDDAITDMISQGDTIKVYGNYMGKTTSGIPKITCEALELNK